MPTLLSKEHVISGSHPDNLIVDETHLTLRKVTKVTQIVRVIQLTDSDIIMILLHA